MDEKKQRFPRCSRSDLVLAIEEYSKMLYGQQPREPNKRREIFLTHPEEAKFFIPLLPEILRGVSPAVIAKIIPFLKLLGFEKLREYMKPNLGILKVQAERLHGTSVLSIPNYPRARHKKWSRDTSRSAAFDWKCVRKKVNRIIDRTRKAEMTSFERFHRAVLGKNPDRIPFVPLMDNFYARVAQLTVREFVSQPYRNILKIVRHTHETFGNYFDMVHLPMGRIYSYFQPVPVAHSGFYAKLFLPDTIGQLLQFVEKKYIDIADFPRLREVGFASLWRKRPLRMILDTMLDFFLVGEFVTYWEQKRRVPMYTGSAIAAPLEALSYLMGMPHWAYALRKKPDETLAACDMMLPGLMANDLILKQFSGVERAYICLERVSPRFLSPKAFETFVWPHLKKIIADNNRRGYINLFHMDTDWGPFLHYFAELPKSGKYIFHLENTNINQAQEIVGDHGALMGNLDMQLLVFGTPEKVKAKVEEMIATVGQGGRWLLGAGCHLPPDTPVENILAIIETIETKGWY